MSTSSGRRITSFLLICIAFVAAADRLTAEVSFGELDLADPDTLLFQANVRAPEFETYSVAFEARLSSGEMAPLTYYPEEIEWLKAREAVQIRNRTGTVHLDPHTAEVTPVDYLDSFAAGDEIATGVISPISVSPDGRYMVIERPESPGYARLILVDTADGSEFTVSEGVPRRGRGETARFAPDGRSFVYSRDGNIFLFSIERFQENRLLSEEFRRIGRGDLENVRWADANQLFVVQGRLVYRLDYSQLFVRSLYQDIVKRGEVVGRIPVAFDGSFDEFWVAPDTELILLNRGGRNLFLGQLGTVAEARGMPFLSLPAGSSVERVTWSSADVITVLLREHKDGHVSIRRIHIENAPHNLEFETVSEQETIRSFERSPDGRYIAIVSDESVEIRHYDSWNHVDTIGESQSRERFIAARWVDGRNLFVASDRNLSMYNRSSQTVQHLAFSQAERLGFDEDRENAVTLNQDNRSATVRYPSDSEDDRAHGDDMRQDGDDMRQDGDEQPAGWPPYRFEFQDEQVALRDSRTAGEHYRVFVDSLSSSSYRNQIMVRDLSALSTGALFDRPQRRFDPFPEEDEDIDFRNFAHGSRVRAREVAVAVNAVAGDDGLADVLSSLERYGFGATFFVTGDFLRRNPDAARVVARSEHEVGNLFSSHIDLTDVSLGITERFIQEGLADTEDRYYEITGDELRLLWHAPYYIVGEEVLDAAEQAGYRHVGRDVDSLDSIPRFTADGREPRYRPTADLIERIVNRIKPGSIIDITLGIPGEDDVFGGREDYLYHRLDVLFQELTARGYTVVPVSRLIERAQEGVQ